MRRTIRPRSALRGISKFLIVLTFTFAATSFAAAQQIKIYPSTVTVDKGSTRTVTALTFDSSGNYLPNKALTFTLVGGNTGAASVRNSPEGTTDYSSSRWSRNLAEVTGMSAGITTLVATVDGIVSSPVQVVVRDPHAAPQAIIHGDNDTGSLQTIRVRTGEAIEVNSDASQGVALAEWFWGDGDTTRDQRSATHAYLLSGSYTLKLRVTNDAGSVSESWVTVDVTDQPAATREFIVHTAAELLAAYNQCVGGENIIIPAGVVITGQVYLPARNFTDFVTIRSGTAMPEMPMRVAPDNTGLAIFQGSYLNEVPFVIGNRASKIRLSGLKFQPYPGGSDYDMNYYLLQIGETTQMSVDDNPTKIIVDHCVVDPPDNIPVVHAVLNDGYKVSIVSSWLGNIKTFGAQDSQAVFTRDGRGAHVYQNTFFEAASESILYGGENNNIDGLVPANIEFRRCVFTKRMSWQGATNSVGETINIKNLFETKNARSVYVEGSLFSNHWDAARTHYFAILLKSVADLPGYEQGSPWGVSEDIVFDNDRISHINGGVSIVRDFYHPEVSYDPIKPRHIRFGNVLFDDMGSDRYGTSRSWAFYLGGVDDLSLKHVSMVDPDDVPDQWPDAGMVIESINSYRMNITDSIMPINAYSFRTVCGEGTAGLNAAASGSFDAAGNSCGGTPTAANNWHVTNNIFPKMRTYFNPAVYPAGNSYPDDFTAVGLNAYHRCGTSAQTDPCDLQISDLAVAANSSFATEASDGTAPGIDPVQLTSRTRCTAGGDTRPCLTAAPSGIVRISGRVMFQKGLLQRATVSLTGVDNTRTVMPDLLGNFTFDNVAPGQWYIVTARSIGHTTTAVSQKVFAATDLTGLDLVLSTAGSGDVKKDTISKKDSVNAPQPPSSSVTPTGNFSTQTNRRLY